MAVRDEAGPATNSTCRRQTLVGHSRLAFVFTQKTKVCRSGAKWMWGRGWPRRYVMPIAEIFWMQHSMYVQSEVHSRACT